VNLTRTRFLQAGCSKVYITSRKAKACDEAVAALNALPNKRPGAVAISIPADSSKVSEIERLVSVVAETTDHVDICVANAGASWGATFENTTETSFDKVMDLNVKSVFYTAQKFAPLLQKRARTEDPSKIIITGSVTGLVPGTVGQNGTYAYSASKAAVIHLARNLAIELAPKGILVNSIAPGFYESKMATPLMELEGGVQKFKDESPNGRIGQPEDIAGLSVFLASRAANHLNGANITTDGGAMLSKGRL
jgi:NAD(P)-dependent dehydrogenase (short-subunit alcohol dehydrogenase family)